MTLQKGHKLWYIPDGYIPTVSSGELESHESICILNCTYEDAHIEVTVYFEDRDPIEKIGVVIPARRTKHVRTGSLVKNGESIPKGVPYAMEVESDIPVIVQYSRLDATQAENSLMTTMAFPLNQ
ncbi:sensory rhodopsin transducer [Paenibacillus sedimenti]|uniref:Sensory rhodopsin transducer n=1 Tax=Paenibacillus sedimenti TaxID=2770274 RepID=A0A926KNY8_9BACL|nr:sensory rhodopsin transducer [Paenibacillus sedimenti]MBD0381347.1 hypothetical protein [Paenibacillus sedimenti]